MKSSLASSGCATTFRPDPSEAADAGEAMHAAMQTATIVAKRLEAGIEGGRARL
jgi:hypothetical protein